MQRLDAVLIATDLYREVPGAGFRDKVRLSVDGYPTTMEFLLQYFREGRNAAKAAERLKRNRLERITLPLNGPFLHQYLRRRGLATEVIPFLSLQKDRLLDLLKERPRTVVISTTFFPFAHQIEAVAALVREHAPDTTVIAGGIQVWKSFQVRSLLDRGDIPPDIRDEVIRDHYLCDLSRPSHLDVLVISDRGEETLAQLLLRIRTGEDFRSLDNTAIFHNGRWNMNTLQPEPQDFLDEALDWSLLPAEWTREEVPVHAGSGCPYRCAFCDFSALRPVRRRSLDSLIGEIRTIPPAEGFRNIFFTDDNLFYSRQQLRAFCLAMEEAHLALRWRAFARVDTIDEETAELLARSGCRECLLGVESGDPEILRRMNKNTSPEDVLRAVTSLNRLGINTQSSFLVGFPGETVRSIQNTIDLLNAYPTDRPGLHVYYPFFFLVAPLAPVSSPESRAKYRLQGYLDRWTHATMSSEEAEEAVLTICDSVKPELSPIYHGERIVHWLPTEMQKRVIQLRNRLNRIRRGILPPEPEEPLWAELEAIFKSVDLS